MKTDLESAINVVLAAKGDDTSHFLFRVVNNSVQLIATNSRIYALCPVVSNPPEISEGEDPRFTVEAWRLKAWLSAVPDGLIIFDHQKGVTKASCARGSQTFASLDPSKVPSWDGLINNATTTGKVKATTFRKVLDYGKKFTDTKDTTRPELCVIDSKDGQFTSSDTRSMCFIKAPGMEKCKIRVHGQDTANITAFLKACGDGEVEIFEQERAFVIRRNDGAFLAETRATVDPPTFGFDPNMVQFRWFFPVEEVSSGLAFLEAGAPKEQTTVRLRRVDQHSVEFSMPSTASGETKLVIPMTLETKEIDTASLPENGFRLQIDHLKRVLSLNSDNQLTVGVVELSNGIGYCQFSFPDECEVTAVVLWAMG